MRRSASSENGGRRVRTLAELAVVLGWPHDKTFALLQLMAAEGQVEPVGEDGWRIAAEIAEQYGAALSTLDAL